MLIIRNNILDFLRWNPYLNLLRPKDGYFSILFLSSKSSFLVGLIVLVIRAGICSWYDEILIERSFYPKDDQFAKWWETPPNHRFQLPIWCLSSKRQFGALTVKPCSRSPFSGAYHQSDSLELLRSSRAHVVLSVVLIIKTTFCTSTCEILS